MAYTISDNIRRRIAEEKTVPKTVEDRVVEHARVKNAPKAKPTAIKTQSGSDGYKLSNNLVNRIRAEGALNNGGEQLDMSSYKTYIQPPSKSEKGGGVQMTKAYSQKRMQDTATNLWLEYGDKSYSEIMAAVSANDTEDPFMKQYENEVLNYIGSGKRTRADIENEIAQTDAELEIAQAEWDRISNDVTTTYGSGNAEEYNAATERVKALTGQKEALEGELWMWDQGEIYSAIPSYSDYQQNSTNENIKTGDAKYNFINNVYGAQDKKGQPDYSPGSNAPYGYMTEEQKGIYNYLYNVSGKKAADEYLDYISYDLNRQRQQEIYQDAFDYTSQGGGNAVAGSIASVGSNLVSGLGYLDVLGQRIQRVATGSSAPIDYNRGAQAAYNFTQGSRQGTASTIGSELGTSVYNLGMSMADSLAIGLITAGIGGGITSVTGAALSAGAKGALATTGTSLLGGSAATSMMHEVKANGGTDAQAIAMGGIAGAAEMIMEALPLDNLLNMGKIANPKQFVLNILKQGGIEATEEALTTLANTAADILIMGDKNELKRSYDEYILRGYSPEEAAKRAKGDWFNGLLQDTVGGFISGLTFGVGGAVVGSVQYRNSDATQNSPYGQAIPELVEESKELGVGGRTADRIQRKLDNGGTVKTKEVNRLVKANEKAFVEEDIGAIQKAAEARLVELGETGDVSVIASALAKEAAGKKPTRAEGTAFANSKYGDRVRNELNPAYIGYGDYSSDWAQKIGTSRVNTKEYNRLADNRSDIEKASDKYGVQAEAMVSTYNAERKDQDVDKYDKAYQVAFNVGKENGNLDVLKKTDAVKELTEWQVERAYEAGQAAAKTVELSNVDRIESIKGGKMTIRLSNGNVIDSSDAIYASEGIAGIYSTVGSLGVTAPMANNIIGTLTEDTNADVFAKGVAEAFKYGKTGMSMTDLMNNSENAKKLTDKQISTAYNAGKKVAGEAVARAQAKAEAKKGTRVGKVHYDGNVDGLDGVRKAGYQAAEMAAKMLGTDIYFFESYAKNGGRYYIDANGNEVKAPNGWYDPRDKSIHLDINAGNSGEGIVLFTLAHELTHYIKDGSPRHFKILANTLFDHLGETESVEELIAKKMKEQNLSHDKAYEEVVADAMETVLNSGNVLNALADIKQQDTSLWNKIKQFFKDFVERLKNIVSTYADARPDSDEGNLVADIEGLIAKLEPIFTEGLAAASENMGENMGDDMTNEEAFTDISYSKKGPQKTFKTGKNSNGEFVANLLIDLNDSSSAWWTGTYNRVMLSMSKTDDTEFKQFYKEVLERTEHMDEYGASEQNAVNDSFVVQDGKGKEYIYHVKLDGYLHGVVLEKIDKAKYDKVYDATAGGKNGQSFSDIERRVGAVRTTARQSGIGNGGNQPSGSTVRYGRMGGTSSQSNLGRDNGGENISNRKISNLTDDGVSYQQRGTTKADTFYSQMARVVDGVKQEKLGASSVISMLRGKGVKAEEIKWSGIEQFLEGKKSVTKAELQEFIAGSMLQIEETTIDSVEEPMSAKDRKKIAALEKERDTLVNKTKSEWRRIFGTSVLDDYAGESLPYDFIGKLTEAVVAKKSATPIGQEYKAAQRAAKEMVEESDYFGFDNARQAYVSMLRDPDSFLRGFELLASEEAVVRRLSEAKARWLELDDAVPDEDVQTLKNLSEDVSRLNAKITDIRIKHSGEQKLPRWGSYKLSGGENYREIVFRLPDSDYSNAAMETHWREFGFKGVLAHARVQDFEHDFSGYKTLFIEEIQSDWHNEGHREGYQKVPDAPFRGNYHEFVLKRLIRDAVENDYDGIGWTTAKTQDERWADNQAHEEGKGKSGNLVGYTIEYDQDIPKFLNKYGKKWGAKVEKSTLPNGTEIWSMDITDSMRESVITEGQPLYQQRSTDGLSNRAILANVLSEVAQDDKEASMLKLYTDNVQRLDEQIVRLAVINAEIKQKSFGKGKRDTARLAELKAEQSAIQKEVVKYDKMLLDLEATAPLKRVLERERKKAYDKAREKGKEALRAQRKKADEKLEATKKQYQEARKKNVEQRKSTVMRNKIKDVVGELNRYLLHGTKDKHIPIGLQKPVAEALDAINMDTVSAERRIDELVKQIAATKNPEKVKELAAQISRIEQADDRMKSKLDSLATAYEEIKKSDDPLIANAYDDVIASTIKYVVAEVGDTPLRDMTYTQLSDVYDMYKMILTKVRDANKAFATSKKIGITEMSEVVIGELKKYARESDKSTVVQEFFRTQDWNNLKPIYAFERMGSGMLTGLYEDLRMGEDTWIKDTEHANKFFNDTALKYQYYTWDMDKRYEFTSRTGVKFSVSLQQILSLYAYSKREQADAHLERGGFVFDDSIKVTEKKRGIPVKYTVTTSKAHNLSREILGEILAVLTPEQRAFADEMQTYLSETMGEKGNEVTLQMYGVKLFKEKNYFPLKSAKQFMFEQNETAGEVRVKNSGFTKEVTPHASNPIILSDFIDVWTKHVNDMAMYHSFVLPLEDFTRVFNFKTPASEDAQSESVKSTLENAFGKQATGYINQLLKDINGGVVTDSRENLAKRLTSSFKKASVLASLSVVAQQPSAIGRAFAVINPKYFVGDKIGAKRHKYLWAELKKYAPVAAIKEMGYFDTNMGKSAADFITSRNYVGFKEKALAIVKDKSYRDEWLTKLPALADELTWCAIWDAVKRETRANNPGMKVNSEEFLTLAGQRFTEVIEKTQVYDSVFARSANMRSKTAAMTMATSFLAEPTTTANMVIDSITKFVRGDKKQLPKVLGAVLTSIVLNSALSSFVYGMRDDDEDETYLEKWISSFVTELIDGVNPLTYLPYVKDVWSLLQGYDVERADMTLISKLVNSSRKISNVLGKDTSDMDEEELLEHRKNIANAFLDFSGDVLNIFGIPMKNVVREFKAFGNLGDMTPIKNTTWMSLADNVADSLERTLPILSLLPNKTKQDKLYEAITSGDEEYAERLMGTYETESALNTAIRKALRNNDDRIKAAAEAKMSGNADEYLRIVNEIVAEGFFSQDNVIAAIKSEVNAMTEDKTSGASAAQALFNADDYFNAVVYGDAADAEVVKNELVEASVAKGNTRAQAESSVASSFVTNVKNAYEEGSLDKSSAIEYITKFGGKSRDEAETEIKEVDFEKKYGYSWSQKDNAFRLGAISEAELVLEYMDIEGMDRDDAQNAVDKLKFSNEYGFDYDDRKDAYLSGQISRTELIEVLTTTGGKTREEAELQVTAYDWQGEGYDINADNKSFFQNYDKLVEPAGIDKGTYYNAYKFYNESGEEGVSYSKTIECMPYIDSLPLTSAQKTALALCWWSEKTVNKYKLW